MADGLGEHLRGKQEVREEPASQHYSISNLGVENELADAGRGWQPHPVDAQFAVGGDPTQILDTCKNH